MKELGIIIPAYNAHDTIGRLLHSISILKCVENVAVCIIDDCSEKSYDYLINKFNELNITIIRHEKNLGPGGARNTGIKWAHKNNIPFILFADADDYFIKFDFWEKIAPEDKINADWIIFQFYDEQAEVTVFDLDIWCFGKIYKTDVIINNNIYFPLTKANEDVVFNFIYYGYTAQKVAIEETIYYWSNNQTSLTHQPDYAENSFIPLVTQLCIYYQFHSKNFTIEQRKIIVLNRLIRLYYFLNEIMFINRHFLSQRGAEFFRLLNNFYNICYKDLEDKITQKDIYLTFNECNAGRSFTSIPQMGFPEFMNKIKEGT